MAKKNYFSNLIDHFFFLVIFDNCSFKKKPSFSRELTTNLMIAELQTSVYTKA